MSFSTEMPSKSIVSENVLIFSPHPDDDVISMGGTFGKLVKQGHNKSKTEKQIMLELGYNRIYDVGNLKFLKKFN